MVEKEVHDCWKGGGSEMDVHQHGLYNFDVIVLVYLVLNMPPGEYFKKHGEKLLILLASAD